MHASRLSLPLALALAASSVYAVVDWRLLSAGKLMLRDGYLDQPYCTLWSNASVTERWVCVITRNNSTEGQVGEHMESLVSDDGGSSWRAQRLEADGAPTNAYGVVAQSAFGRIYTIYNMNMDKVHSLPNGQPISRDDELGYFVVRWSDDGGDSWREERRTIPLRNTAIDRNNSFNGATQIMWSVDQVKTAADGSTQVWAYTKIGTYPQNPPEQVFVLSSPNMLTETNASAVQFNLYPNGDEGIGPLLPTANFEEGHVVSLMDGAPGIGMFAIARTSVGVLAAAATADPTGATGWGPAHAATYWAALPAAAGRALKNPQGPVTLKRVANRNGHGRYLLLYYFQGTPGYSQRDPMWIAAGKEEAGEVKFSQPEVVLYDYTLLTNRPGYPDFVQTSNGSIFITETNKTDARIHLVDAGLLALLFAQDTLSGVAPGNLSLAFTGGSQGQRFPTPPLPTLASYEQQGAGTSIGLWVTNHSAAAAAATAAEQVLVDVGTLRVTVGGGGSVTAWIADGAGHTGNLTTDEACTARLLAAAGPHYLVLNMDGGAHLLSFSVDGAVCDGGSASYYGWSFVSPSFGSLATGASPSFVLGSSYAGSIVGGQWYARLLLNSEAVGNWRAGP